MNKELLKSSWLMAGIILVTNVVIGWIFLFIFNLFNMETTSSLPSIISVIAASMILGMIYAKNFKEVMPKKQRLKSSALYVTFALILSLSILSEFLYDKVLFMIILITTVIVSAISFAIVYYFLRKGGEIYLKSKNATNRNSSR